MRSGYLPACLQCGESQTWPGALNAMVIIIFTNEINCMIFGTSFAILLNIVSRVHRKESWWSKANRAPSRWFNAMDGRKRKYFDSFDTCLIMMWHGFKANQNKEWERGEEYLTLVEAAFLIAHGLLYFCVRVRVRIKTHQLSWGVFHHMIKILLDWDRLFKWNNCRHHPEDNGDAVGK